MKRGIALTHGAALAALLFPFLALGDACGDAVALLKRLEGFRSSPYTCQAGEWAIGYGFTDAALIARGHMTQAEADRELKSKCDRLVQKVRRDLKGRRLADSQIAAIVSFAYNVGWGNYITSKVHSMVLRGDSPSAVGEEIRKWVFVCRDGRKVKSSGLQKRRLSEAVMFAKQEPRKK